MVELENLDDVRDYFSVSTWGAQAFLTKVP